MGAKIDDISKIVILIVLMFSLLLIAGCAQKTGAKAGCDISGTYLDCDRWSVCQNNERTRTCRDLLGCLEISSFKETQNCEISVKTGQLKTGPAIADFCNNDDVCDKGENYHLCPNDCSANAIDGLCNDVSNNVCDPDCLTSDKDCFPVITKFTREMTTTNFSGIKNMKSVKGFELGIKDKGAITFSDKLDLLGLNLDEEVSIGENRVAYTDMLDSPATITLFNLDFIKPAILYDDKLCKNCRIKEYKNETLIFKVYGPGEYSAKETAELTEEEKEKAAKQGESPKFYQGKKFSILMIILLALLIVFGAFYTFFKNITFHIHMPHKEHKEKKVAAPPPLMEIKPYLPEKEEKKGKGKKGKKKRHRDERIGIRRIVKAKPRSIKVVKHPPKNPHKVTVVPRKKKKKGKKKGSGKTLMKVNYNPQKAKRMFKEGMKVVKERNKDFEKRLKEQMKKQKEHGKLMKKKARGKKGKIKTRKVKRKPAKRKKIKTTKRKVKKKVKKGKKKIKRAVKKKKKSKKKTKKSTKKKPKKKRKK